jgi:hypothetical protein
VVSTELIWLRIGTGGGSCEQGNGSSASVTFLGNILVAERRVASQGGLSSMELVVL